MIRVFCLPHNSRASLLSYRYVLMHVYNHNFSGQIMAFALLQSILHYSVLTRMVAAKRSTITICRPKIYSGSTRWSVRWLSRCTSVPSKHAQPDRTECTRSKQPSSSTAQGSLLLGQGSCKQVRTSSSFRCGKYISTNCNTIVC